jgi:hypothetical protein
MFNMISAHERQTTLNIINEAGHFVYQEHRRPLQRAARH